MKIVLLFLLLLVSPAARGEAVLQVVPGFKAERVAGPPAVHFPMFATLDDKKRLYVTESSGGDLYAELSQLVRGCRISMLEDRDGDGRYERGSVFAEKLAPSMGLVWHEGKLYAADPPELVTLEDTDGDGRADKRTVILRGFGHRDNGSLHGLTFGPDGWLYFTTGNPDGYDLTGPDSSHARGGAGALIRCRPDGSGVETLARGFENLVEIVFLPDGSIVGTLTWYQVPERGIRDALIQILEGGVFPLHPVDSVPHLQFDTLLPPLALFPAVAHSGLELYRGNAFPPEMCGNLFSAEHNSRKIVRHRLTPKGAFYTVETFDFVTTDDPDVHFSDVLEDKDGSLLVVDTGSWYVQHCPTGRIRQAPARGGIYRVSFDHASKSSERPLGASPTDWLPELKSSNLVAVAAAARMVGRVGQTNAASELTKLLRAPSLGVRLAAAEALGHCGSEQTIPALVEALADETDDFLEHALIFALHRLVLTPAPLLSGLNHPSPKVQRASLLLLEQPPFSAQLVEAVVARLNSADARLRDTARWVLLRHPEWDRAGAAFVRQMLTTSDASNPTSRQLGKFLSVFRTNAAVLAAIAGSLSSANHEASEAQRLRLLEAMATLEMDQLPHELGEAIRQLLADRNPAIRSEAIRVAGALRLAEANEDLAKIARDREELPRVRMEALRELLRRRAGVENLEMQFLLGQLAVSNAATARLSAAEILVGAKLSAAQMNLFLNKVRGDGIISPASILQAVERNHLEADCATTLLDYLGAALDAGWTLPAEQLARLRAAVAEVEKQRAARLLKRVSENVESQREQLRRFEALLKGGNPLRGEKLFFDKAQCVSCHRVWENGGRVGPDLTKVGSIRSGPDLLESIILPSATIAQDYDTLIVTTKDGESYTGVRVGKSEDPLLLRNASGADVILHQAQIERIERSKLSLMPEGLLNTLTREDIQDLLAYLQELK